MGSSRGPTTTGPFLGMEGVASKWLTHHLCCASSGLCLHGRLPQLLGQLPHAVLYPLQEDLPQHHAGLGKGVHFLTPLPPSTLSSCCFSVGISQLPLLCCGNKRPQDACVRKTPVCVLLVLYMCCTGWGGLGLISVLTPNPKLDSSRMDLWESARGRPRS